MVTVVALGCGSVVEKSAGVGVRHGLGTVVMDVVPDGSIVAARVAGSDNREIEMIMRNTRSSSVFGLIIGQRARFK